MQMIIHQNRAMNEKAPPLFLRCQAIDKSAFTFLFTERRIFLLAVHALNSGNTSNEIILILQHSMKFEMMHLKNDQRFDWTND